jgi:gamma-glutamylcyclotransferase (GGCT)/AIG2-like uncharacterized protein YtfP
MARHFYFAYGSNMNPQRVMQRGMAFDHAQKGVLRDYQLAFNKRSVKHVGAASANVMRVPGSHVEGIMYRLTSMEQIHEMDPFEGYPTRYSRFELPVETMQGRFLSWVYVANEAYISDGLRPARWYLDHLLAGRDYLSVEYYRALSSIRTLDNSAEEPV